MARYLVGVDVGGTFTDFVSYDRESHALEVWKNLTTPDDPTLGIACSVSPTPPPSTT
jgi:N-methylhydantoinase A